MTSDRNNINTIQVIICDYNPQTSIMSKDSQILVTKNGNLLTIDVGKVCVVPGAAFVAVLATDFLTMTHLPQDNRKGVWEKDTCK